MKIRRRKRQQLFPIKMNECDRDRKPYAESFMKKDTISKARAFIFSAFI